MSAKASFWSREYGKQMKLKSSLRSILRELSHCHNQDTNRCDPSIPHISDYSGLNKKTIMAGLSELENLGAITVKKRNGARTKYQINFHIFNAQTSTKNDTTTEINTTTESGTAPVPKTVSPPVPKTVLETKSKPKKNLKDIYEGFPSSVDRDLFDEFVAMRKELKKPLTEKAIERKVEKLQSFDSLGYDLNQILIKSIDNCWLDLYEPKPHGGKNGEIDVHSTDWG